MGRPASPCRPPPQRPLKRKPVAVATATKAPAVKLTMVAATVAEGEPPRQDIGGAAAKAPWWQKFRVKAAAQKAEKKLLQHSSGEKARPQRSQMETHVKSAALAGAASSGSSAEKGAAAKSASWLPAPPAPPPPAMPWMRENKGSAPSGEKKDKGKGRGKKGKIKGKPK